ncbi:unnamed protein product, partial [marine sediment metagenome]
QDDYSYVDIALRKEIAPPGVNWLPWVAGGVVVLGVGTVAVLAGRKRNRKEVVY